MVKKYLPGRVTSIVMIPLPIATMTVGARLLKVTGLLGDGVAARVVPIFLLSVGVVVSLFLLYSKLDKILSLSKGEPMSSEITQYVLDLIEAEVQRRPRVAEFEMAYQTRIAIDRIKFAIKQTEQFGPRTEEMREVGLQLLDALNRLESADRQFQKRFRHAADPALQETAAQTGNGSAPTSQRRPM